MTCLFLDVIKFVKILGVVLKLLFRMLVLPRAWLLLQLLWDTHAQVPNWNYNILYLVTMNSLLFITSIYFQLHVNLSFCAYPAGYTASTKDYSPYSVPGSTCYYPSPVNSNCSVLPLAPRLRFCPCASLGTSAPTASSVTMSPVTSLPSAAPLTTAPSLTPVTILPTLSPSTKAPTLSPSTTVPTAPTALSYL